MESNVNEILTGAGRDLACRMLQDALSSTSTAQQAVNQVYVLRRLAVCLLAHELYNEVRRTGKDVLASTADLGDRTIDDYLQKLMDDVFGDLKNIASTPAADMELHRVKGGAKL